MELRDGRPIPLGNQRRLTLLSFRSSFACFVPLTRRRPPAHDQECDEADRERQSQPDANSPRRRSDRFQVVFVGDGAGNCGPQHTDYEQQYAHLP